MIQISSSSISATTYIVGAEHDECVVCDALLFQHTHNPAHTAVQVPKGVAEEPSACEVRASGTSELWSMCVVRREVEEEWCLCCHCTSTG